MDLRLKANLVMTQIKILAMAALLCVKYKRGIHVKDHQAHASLQLLGAETK